MPEHARPNVPTPAPKPPSGAIVAAARLIMFTIVVLGCVGGVRLGTWLSTRGRGAGIGGVNHSVAIDGAKAFESGGLEQALRDDALEIGTPQERGYRGVTATR